jgi:hypothetical protein
MCLCGLWSAVPEHVPVWSAVPEHVPVWSAVPEHVLMCEGWRCLPGVECEFCPVGQVDHHEEASAQAHALRVHH